MVCCRWEKKKTRESMAYAWRMSLAGTPEISSNLRRFSNVIPQNLKPNQNDVAAPTLYGIPTPFHFLTHTLNALHATHDTRFPSFIPNPNSSLHFANTEYSFADAVLTSSEPDPPPLLFFFLLFLCRFCFAVEKSSSSVVTAEPEEVTVLILFSGKCFVLILFPARGSELETHAEEEDEEEGGEEERELSSSSSSSSSEE